MRPTLSVLAARDVYIISLCVMVTVKGWLIIKICSSKVADCAYHVSTGIYAERIFTADPPHDHLFGYRTGYDYWV